MCGSASHPAVDSNILEPSSSPCQSTIAGRSHITWWRDQLTAKETPAANSSVLAVLTCYMAFHLLLALWSTLLILPLLSGTQLLDPGSQAGAWRWRYFGRGRHAVRRRGWQRQGESSVSPAGLCFICSPALSGHFLFLALPLLKQP